ncbi:MAG: peptidoglycan -binding protein [Pseudomonadota bacterium]|nr:peptidoglycan -binding protein [Pseudomonadota bacterium]
MVFTIAQFFLSEILTGRNDALDRLNRQIAELSEVLALEQKSNEDLKIEITQLTNKLNNSITAGEYLAQNLAIMTENRNRLVETLAAKEKELQDSLSGNISLTQALAVMTQKNDRLAETLAKKEKEQSVDREKIRVQLATLQSLKNDIESLRKARKALEEKIVALVANLEENKSKLTAVRDRSKVLEAALSSEKERTALVQRELNEKKIGLKTLTANLLTSSQALAAQRSLSEKATARINLLNRQIVELRRQLAKISLALEASEEKAKSQNFQIVNLGKRLNEALAQKVQELAKFRSEFFGKLRQALGNTQGVRVEGDRFVFQSEVLFPSSSTVLFGNGERQIIELAKTLKDIASRVPKEVDWILRVDGHTDDRPIKTAYYPSNWELSAARAIAVVKKLVAQGIPPHRLAATGFGEFRPIDNRQSKIAFSRNRRIEFKLTGR